MFPRPSTATRVSSSASSVTELIAARMLRAARHVPGPLAYVPNYSVYVAHVVDHDLCHKPAGGGVDELPLQILQRNNRDNNPPKAIATMSTANNGTPITINNTHFMDLVA